MTDYPNISGTRYNPAGSLSESGAVGMAAPQAGESELRGPAPPGALRKHWRIQRRHAEGAASLPKSAALAGSTSLPGEEAPEVLFLPVSGRYADGSEDMAVAPMMTPGVSRPMEPAATGS